MMNWISRSFVALFVLAMLTPSRCLAQSQEDRKEYVIGHGDLLSITFWQRPELNTESRVTAAGDIELPLIGTMRAAGLTPSSLRDNILSRISLLDIRVTQVAVVVREYASKSVYVTGSVGAPGKLNFEAIPNLWQIILEAGGPLPAALLDDVTIVRGGGREAGKIIHVDLTNALEQGDFSLLPPIYPGDTVHVPGAPAGGAGAVSLSPLERRDVVSVLGQVASPGTFNLEKDMDLFDALVLAGGPTEAADLKNVKLFFRGRRHAEMAVVDMNRYMNRSVPLPLVLHSGDAIYVPRKSGLPPIVGEIGRLIITSVTSFLIFSLSRSL
jgi:polysaccharide export outer membrane protein